MHFSQESYDYFKYQGKLKVTEQSFEQRRDKYMFHKLAKREDVFEHLVANLSDNPQIWVGELFEPKAEAKTVQFIKRQQSMTYTFKNEIDQLLDDFDQNFKVQQGGYPYLLKLLTNKKVSIETIIILNDCVGFFSYWNKRINDPVLWPKIAMQCKKLFPFMQYDKDKYITMIKDKYSC